jgi:phage recombination protein Bet
MSTNESQVITADEVRKVETERRSLVSKFAEKYGLESNKLMATLKATAFKGDVTNEQMAALLIVADQYNLNPWTKEIYAFPSRSGIVPVVSVDGWARIINEHPEFDGMDFALTRGEKEGSEAYTCTMHRKDRGHPTTVTEYMVECRRATDPWNSHPLRMLRHKAMIQCARLAFSFAGIYDPDEAERVVAAEAIDVTPRSDDPELPQVNGKVAPKKLRKIVEALLEAVKAEDGPGLLQVWNELESEEQEFVWNKLRSWERSSIKALREKAQAADCGVGLVGWALETLNGAKDLKALGTVWNAIQAAYDENGQEVPADVETIYVDRKAELSK